MDVKDWLPIRKTLHTLAELSNEEKNTATMIVHLLKEKCNPDVLHTDIGGYGIVAEYRFDDEGPTTLFRADFDALPIPETIDIPHCSKTDGVSHKCGHDGHSTTMLAFAEFLSKNRHLFKGRILALFQPAEEIAQGAQKMLNDPKFAALGHVDFAFGQHNLPGFPAKSIVIRSGVFAAASRGIIAKFFGTTSHAAHPESGKSPAMAVASLIQMWTALPQLHVPFSHMGKVSIVRAKYGGDFDTFGTCPATGLVSATLRAAEDADMTTLCTRAEKIAHSLADMYGLRCEISYNDVFHAVKNKPEYTVVAKQCAEELIKEGIVSTVVEKPEPFSWSEDFGLFTTHIDGAFFGIGAGEEHPQLHDMQYDFNDDVIYTGMRMFLQLALHYNKKVSSE